MKWYVDGSHAVHPDCKGHTVSLNSLSSRAITSSSTKQKINMQSLTETKLVATNNMMPQVLWTNYFLKAQDYDIKDTIVYQDKQVSHPT